VFTPRTAPETKKAAIRALGATLRDDPDDYDAAEAMAHAYAEESHALFISPYNHPDVIAGAGTVALELLDAAPDLDIIVVPLGGGGLASGIGMVFKHAAPHVRVIGVEMEASTAFSTSLAHGQITRVDVKASLADGLVGNLDPDTITFDVVRNHIDRIVTVDEQSLRRAMQGLVREEHLVAEGAGAAATAAVSSGQVRGSRPIAVIVSGGNIDVQRLVDVLAGS
jgi:threonine dehydratase